MACKTGCGYFFGNDPPVCAACWIPKGTAVRDTIDLIDRSEKFGYRNPAVDARCRTIRSAVRMVIFIPDLAELVESYLILKTYEKHDLIDAIDECLIVYEAVILDRWYDETTSADWFLIRFVGYRKSADILVQQSAIMPRFETNYYDDRSAWLSGKSTIYINSLCRPQTPIDDRWKSVDRLPVCPILPSYMLLEYIYGQTAYRSLIRGRSFFWPT